jgi:glutathione S-transferase/GNAT superfamily N-acetyltransferase
MKLYITPGSPYARMARIVVLEKGLEGRVEVIAAQTRHAGSPYYSVNPSGRVPYLIRDDGVGLEESAVICAYLDQLDGKPAFNLPAGEQAWEARRLEALARSLMDGLAVWSREITRPQNERSATILQHEAQRGGRMADLWEKEIGHPLMRGALNMAQITLVCALGLEARNPDLHWRAGHPKLSDWFGHIAAQASIAATAPPKAGMVIRPADGHDAPGVAACVAAAYRHYVERIGRLPGPMTEDYAKVIRERRVSVAESNGRIAGVLVLTATEEGFLLENVAVDPSHRGMGLGRTLLEFAEAEARREGFDSIYLYTHEKMTENLALYAKIGYVEFDRRTENGFARVYMRKSL